MWHTYKLIAIDSEMADKSFNPYMNLGLPMPTNVRDGFGSAEVKKAYRKLARKFHPDKQRLLNDVERKAASATW